jgi:transcription termination/antitermination protein NusG
MTETNKLDTNLEIKQWYALQTRSRHEKQVAQRIVAQSLEAFLPVHCSTHLWKNGVRATVEMPLFPGYLFAKASMYDRTRLLRVSGVLGMASSSSHPTAIPETDIKMLRTVTEQLSAEPHPYLAIGDAVRIVSGPLAGMEGTLTRKKNQYRVVLSIEAIMRSITVEVSEYDIEPYKRASVS